jgi:hypothetical protein
MIQNRLGKVIDGHHYTSWLRKEVNESDAQLAKYKNRIEVLQKHVKLFDMSFLFFFVYKKK